MDPVSLLVLAFKTVLFVTLEPLAGKKFKAGFEKRYLEEVFSYIFRH